jgi:hypothetical protein
MYARVVRFTEVTPERITEIQNRIEQQEGPPPGVEANGFKLLADESQGTALFIGFFDSEEKMRAAAQVLEQMDPSETPGTRVSIDECEVKVEREA